MYTRIRLGFKQSWLKPIHLLTLRFHHSSSWGLALDEILAKIPQGQSVTIRHVASGLSDSVLEALHPHGVLGTLRLINRCALALYLSLDLPQTDDSHAESTAIVTAIYDALKKDGTKSLPPVAVVTTADNVPAVRRASRAETTLFLSLCSGLNTSTGFAELATQREFAKHHSKALNGTLFHSLQLKATQLIYGTIDPPKLTHASLLELQSKRSEVPRPRSQKLSLLSSSTLQKTCMPLSFPVPLIAIITAWSIISSSESTLTEPLGRSKVKDMFNNGPELLTQTREWLNYLNKHRLREWIRISGPTTDIEHVLAYPDTAPELLSQFVAVLSADSKVSSCCESNDNLLAEFALADHHAYRLARYLDTTAFVTLESLRAKLNLSVLQATDATHIVFSYPQLFEYCTKDSIASTEGNLHIFSVQEFLIKRSQDGRLPDVWATDSKFPRLDDEQSLTAEENILTDDPNIPQESIATTVFSKLPVQQRQQGAVGLVRFRLNDVEWRRATYQNYCTAWSTLSETELLDIRSKLLRWNKLHPQRNKLKRKKEKLEAAQTDPSQQPKETDSGETAKDKESDLIQHNLLLMGIPEQTFESRYFFQLKAQRKIRNALRRAAFPDGNVFFDRLVLAHYLYDYLLISTMWIKEGISFTQLRDDVLPHHGNYIAELSHENLKQFNHLLHFIQDQDLHWVLFPATITDSRANKQPRQERRDESLEPEELRKQQMPSLHPLDQSITYEDGHSTTDSDEDDDAVILDTLLNIRPSVIDKDIPWFISRLRGHLPEVIWQKMRNRKWVSFMKRYPQYFKQIDEEKQCFCWVYTEQETPQQQKD